MKKVTTFLIAIAAILVSCTGKQESDSTYQISYNVSFDIPEKYLDVDMTYIASGNEADAITFKMPVWAPGYYIILDYPKNLTAFRAKDSKGNDLKWDKVSKNAWKVETADTMHISYKIFADAHSVAECRLEDSIAFVPGNGVYMHVDGDVNHPVSVTFNMPETWSKISTSLELKDGAYYAPDFDVLYDSPVLLGNQYTEFVEHEGHTYEFAVETPQGFAESPLKDDFLKAVDQAIAIFGDTAYDSYHLLLMGAGGGGLEHQASQADYTDGHWDFDSQDRYLRMLLFVTHEYFHNYNVKAIRPAELWPFDYDKENYTTGLWISEGITCFYESELLYRAGIITDEQNLAYMSEYIRDTQHTEGRKGQSMRQSSYDIWLNFFNRNANAGETTISYYVKGPVIGILMDCQIKTMTGGKKSLDDVMKNLYWKYYKNGRGFTEEEFWADAESIAGGSLQNIRHYVDTTDEIDYESILTPAGLKLDHETWSLSRL